MSDDVSLADDEPEFDIGHNGGPSLNDFEGSEVKPFLDVLNSTAQQQLKTIVERVENLNKQKEDLTGDIREIMAEAKGSGFDAKIIRKIITERKKDQAKRAEEIALMELYEAALEMVK